MQKYEGAILWNNKIAKNLGLSKEEFEAVLTRRYKRQHPEEKDVECVLDFEY
jgi:hypothetical protein